MALVLEIRTTSKKAAADIKALATKAGASVRILEKQSVSSSKRMTASFSRLSGALGALGLGLGLAAVGQGLKRVVSLASDTEESMNKVKEVFGEASKAVIKFSDDAAVSLGTSRQQALAMTGEIGNLLVAMKFSEDQAGDFSTKMVQLAADLGSFNNVPTVDALNAIRSALVGESEPIRRFGADVRQTRLDSIALGLGLEFTKGKMSAQVKALAAMEAIMRDTRKAQGDFKRTSDGLANSTKILTANFNDLAANIGEKLLPIVNEAVLAINSLFFDVESNAIKTKKLNAEIFQLEAQIKRAGLESKSSKETLGGFFGAIDDGVRALGRFTGIGIVSAEQLAEWEKRLAAAKKELKELNKAVKTNIDLTVVGQGDQLEMLRKRAKLRGEELEGLKSLADQNLAIAISLQTQTDEEKNLDIAKKAANLTKKESIKLNKLDLGMDDLKRQSIVNMVGAFNTLANSRFASEKAMKPLLIASAIANTALGVTKALGSGIPPFNFIQAALVGAAGAAQVATIASSGLAKGGSFIVPGTGSGDRPFTLGLEPGERVDVTPRNQVNNNQKITMVNNFHFQIADEITIKTKVIPILNDFVERQGGKLVASKVA